MGDIQKVLPEPLQRRRGETDKSHAALIGFYEMGPARTLADLARTYAEQEEKGCIVPTSNYDTLQQWSSRFAWFDRVREVQQLDYARELEALHQKRIEFIGSQLEVLTAWKKALAVSLPRLDKVSFKDWSASAGQYIQMVQAVFGLHPENMKIEVNTHVGNDRDRSGDDGEATQRLLELLESVGERASLERSTRGQDIIDAESRPVRQGGDDE